MRTYSGSARKHPLTAVRYLVAGDETSNFTYEIANRDELADVVARALDAPAAAMREYIAELDGDDEFARDLEARLRRRKGHEPRVYFGRRIGWYALVRWLKPRLVVETGTADGLGSAALARALHRNEAEGVSGQLLTFDIDPNAGWLLGEQAPRGARIVIGDQQRPSAGSWTGVRSTSSCTTAHTRTTTSGSNSSSPSTMPHHGSSS